MGSDINFFGTAETMLQPLGVWPDKLQLVYFDNIIWDSLLDTVMSRNQHIGVQERQYRCDSIQGTDYIANPFFLNLKVSSTTIENLRWQFGGNIIQATFGKSVTSLVQKRKKKFK